MTTQPTTVTTTIPATDVEVGNVIVWPNGRQDVVTEVSEARVEGKVAVTINDDPFPLAIPADHTLTVIAGESVHFAVGNPDRSYPFTWEGQTITLDRFERPGEYHSDFTTARLSIPGTNFDTFNSNDDGRQHANLGVHGVTELSIQYRDNGVTFNIVTERNGVSRNVAVNLFADGPVLVNGEAPASGFFAQDDTTKPEDTTWRFTVTDEDGVTEDYVVYAADEDEALAEANRLIELPLGFHHWQARTDVQGFTAIVNEGATI